MRLGPASLSAGTAVFACALAFGQGTGPVTFEVASVKPSTPGWERGGVYFGPARGGPGTPDPGQIACTHARFKRPRLGQGAAAVEINDNVNRPDEPPRVG